MNRQLRMGGGIMDIVPREPAILGGIKKAVKKVTRGVKKIASSDIGKAALIGAAAFGIPGTSIGGIFGRSSFMLPAGGSAPGIFGFGGIGNALAAGKTALGIGGESTIGTLGNLTKGPNALKLGESVSKSILGGNIGKFATLGGLSAFLTSQFNMSEEQQAEVLKDPTQLKSYLRMYYENLNPGADEKEVEEFVEANTAEYTAGLGGYAEGGRIGFDEGTPKTPREGLMSISDLQIQIPTEDEDPQRSLSILDNVEAEEDMVIIITIGPDGEPILKQVPRSNIMMDPVERIQKKADGGRIGFAKGDPLPPDPTQPVNPFKPKPIGPVLPNKEMASNMEMDKLLEALFEKYLDMGLSPEDARKKAIEDIEKMGQRKMEDTRGLAALGGKMDTASDNAMQAAGVEGLPVRQNPKGVKELDLRETGGFIPPVGIKEKEDDIPAMLSNNEFVFTADAVRGAGDGDVNVGAQRMYDMMKKLEAGGRV